MVAVLLSDVFEEWLDDLRDVRARTKIVARIRSMSAGNFGDAKSLGDKLMEVRLHFGPGYRLYYTRRGAEVYLLLVAGTKRSQRDDIARAKQMVADLAKEQE